MDIYFLNWLTFAISLSAFVYSVILTDTGHVLAPIYDFLKPRLHEKIFKPLIGCQYCVSGQWALWFYFYITLIQNEAKYHWWLHLWFIMQTIFLVEIISYLYFKILHKEEHDEKKKREQKSESPVAIPSKLKMKKDE